MWHTLIIATVETLIITGWRIKNIVCWGVKIYANAMFNRGASVLYGKNSESVCFFSNYIPSDVEVLVCLNFYLQTSLSYIYRISFPVTSLGGKNDPSLAIMLLQGLFFQYGRWSKPFSRLIKPNSVMLVPVKMVCVSFKVPFL